MVFMDPRRTCFWIRQSQGAEVLAGALIVDVRAELRQHLHHLGPFGASKRRLRRPKAHLGT